MFANVSEPTVDRLPEIPLTFLYSGNLGSRPAANALCEAIAVIDIPNATTICLIFIFTSPSIIFYFVSMTTRYISFVFSVYDYK